MCRGSRVERAQGLEGFGFGAGLGFGVGLLSRLFLKSFRASEAFGVLLGFIWLQEPPKPPKPPKTPPLNPLKTP